MANPWYKTGTVAVTSNSKTVTGAGTLFVVNAVAAGDIFFAPDGLAYEIESVESDIQFTLVNVYAGSTQSGQPYGIVRFMSQSPISLANLIVDKTVSWENVIDQMSLYISGTASTSSVAPEDLCINYSIGTVQTGIAEVDCPTGFTFVASGANIASGWYLFEDTVGNYRVAMHPETLKAEVSAIKDLAVTAQAGAETAQSLAELARDTAQPYLMSKAEFEALAQARRNELAGSGFVEYGGEPSGVSTQNPINNGMYTVETNQNQLNLGYETPPLLALNGNTVRPLGVNTASANQNKIILPSAPTVTHADSTNSGLVSPAAITGTAYCSASAVDRVVTVTTTGELNYARARLLDNLVIGETYFLELDYDAASSTGEDKWAFGHGGTYFDGSYTTLRQDGRYYLEFVASATTLDVTFSSSAIETIVFNFIAVIPKSALSRQDLVFIESWHEDISEKGIVYPYGNVQYLGADTDGLTGIANGIFTGFETYSLFGNWQASSALIGKGYVWANLTAAQQAAFAGNPLNNIYQDSDTVVQVRYRIRVVEGKSDGWRALQDFYPSTAIDAVSCEGFAGDYLLMQGALVSTDDFAPTGTGTSDRRLNTGGHSNGIKEVGIFGNAILPASAGYNGHCYAMPIALVTRKHNQGAYHPIFNKGGTRKVLNTANTLLVEWHDSNAKQITSTIDCFDFSSSWVGGVADGILPPESNSTGSIAGLVANVGNPDDKFYDAVYADDIIDLRNSARKNPTKENMLSVVQNAINGTKRSDYDGDGEWETYTYSEGIGGNLLYNYNDNRAVIYTYDLQEAYNVGDIISFAYFDGTSFTVYSRARIQSLNAGAGTIIIDGFNLSNLKASAGYIVATGSNYVILSRPSTRKSSGEKLHCDLIGDPAFYPKTTIDYTTTGATQTVSVVKGDKVSYAVASGSTGVGTVGNYYVAKVDQASIDLDTQDFSNTTNWIDTGSTNTVDWQGALAAGYTGAFIPLVVGENGEDYIPDGVTTAFKLSHKDKSVALVLKSSDSGVTWSVLAVTTDYTVSTTANTITYTTAPAVDDITMVFYTTTDNYTYPVVNTAVLPDGVGDDVYATNGYNDDRWVSMSVNLIGKAGTANVPSVDIKKMLGSTLLYGKLSDENWGTNAHQPIDIVASNPAVKFRPVAVSENGRLCIDLHFKEMKYDDATVNEDGTPSNTWGDDSLIDIADNVTTTPDDNGNTVLIGTKRIKTEFFV